jgi:DNA polymerase-3 subunit beta
VVAARSPRPQLTCVKLDATNGANGPELALSATDADLALTVRLGRVEVSEPGATLIPADKLRQIVSAEDNEPTLTIEADGDTAHIKGEDAHFQLHGFSAEEFPAIPSFKSIAEGAGGAKAVFTTTAGTLSALITRTLFAAARENSRYAINGVLLVREGKKLEMVATDGRRLAKCTATTEAKGESAKCIVPSKALSMLLKLADEPEEPVHVAITDSRAVFAFGDDATDGRATLSTSLVEGTFPPYEDVIPKDQDIRGDLRPRHPRLSGASCGAADERGVPRRAPCVQGCGQGPGTFQPGPRDGRGPDRGGPVRLRGQRHRDRLQPDLPDRRPQGHHRPRGHHRTESPEQAGAGQVGDRLPVCGDAGQSALTTGP